VPQWEHGPEQSIDETDGIVMKSSHILAVVLAIGAAAWVLSGQLGNDAPATASTATAELSGSAAAEEALTQVRVATSTSEPYVIVLSVTGRTEANREVGLRVQTSGRIEAIEVDEGDVVEEGDVIARIAMDDRPERLARAQAVVEQFQIAFDASSELAEGGWRAETTHAEANANLRDARAELARVRLDIGRTDITAPFSGVLNSVGIEVGDVVTDGFGENDAIGEIYDLDPIVIVAAVNEREVSYLSVGDLGSAHLITGATVEGVLRFVGQVAEPETRTYRIELEVANEDHAIRAGMTTDVVLPLDTIPGHFISPSALSLADDGTLGVKLVDENNVVRFAPIVIVADVTGGLWVTGLAREVTMITVGHDFVAEGETVEPVRVRGSSFSEAP
jgi:membrane fusion protein, multidrug efflux system